MTNEMIPHDGITPENTFNLFVSGSAPYKSPREERLEQALAVAKEALGYYGDYKGNTTQTGSYIVVNKDAAHIGDYGKTAQTALTEIVKLEDNYAVE